MKHLTAEAIIQIIETPHEQSQTHFIVQHAPVREVLKALMDNPNAHMRQILCDILGYQKAKSGVPALIEALDAQELRVRCAAGDALGKVGDPRAGAALMEHYMTASHLPECRTLAVALGAVRYRPAVPALIEALSSEDESLRGCAAWSLGELRAQEALALLKRALANELRPYPKARMQEAIAQLSGTAA